jgi:hypothetical protein
VTTLRRGQYFGHSIPSAECCIRARTRVRLLAIDGAVADALGEVRPDLALLLKQDAPVEPPLDSSQKKCA